MDVPEQAIADSAAAGDLGARLLRVAWLSIVLGLLLEFVLLALDAADGSIHGIGVYVADFVQKVSWSSVVCVGLALGTAAAKAARPAVMGVLGLLSAPAAFAVARMLHKSAAQALDVAVSAGMSPGLAATVKAIEYGCFGVAIGWMSRRRPASLGSHLLVGAITGIVFGAVIVYASAASATVRPSPAVLLGRGLNELLFPVGCSIVLYVASALGDRAATR